MRTKSKSVSEREESKYFVLFFLTLLSSLSLSLYSTEMELSKSTRKAYGLFCWSSFFLSLPVRFIFHKEFSLLFSFFRCNVVVLFFSHIRSFSLVHSASNIIFISVYWIQQWTEKKKYEWTKKPLNKKSNSTKEARKWGWERKNSNHTHIVCTIHTK